MLFLFFASKIKIEHGRARIFALPGKTGGKAGIVKKSSMADVARLAGVSTATVSHVINRSRFVSEEVTQQVEKAIRQLNYIPNQMARNLKTGRNHTVLFIVPDIANSFFATAIEAVESVLVAAGYRLVIANTKEDFAREAVHLQGAGNGTIDGLLLASTAGQWEQVAPLLPAGLPTVLVDRVFEHTGSSVSVDSAAALGQVVKALAAQGHARIGFISGIARLSSTKERLAAYRQAMAACGLPVEDGFVQTGDSMRGSSPQCCEKLLALGCTAIIVSNGVMACDVAYYCMQHHTKAALVGYVDSPLQSRMAPYFASVFLPTEELGRCAGQEILRLMANPGAVPQAVRLPAQFRPSAQAGAAPCCKPEQEP